MDTFAGKVHVEWDPSAAVTPIGQLPFFIQFLKHGGLFEPWVKSCPLHYTSNNAPKKVDVLGSFLLSILSGHNRYAHIASLIGDSVNAQLLGMSKVVSDDSAQRALKKMDEADGVDWLQAHLQRADCENNFDEIKNHWGWGGFTTKDIKPCRFIARIIALIYNWRNIFVRLANPEKHLEAITSRPLLLSSVGRLTEHGRQKTMTITSTHARADAIQQTYERIQRFFKSLKAIAPQLTPDERWCRILSEAMKKYLGGGLLMPPGAPASAI